MAALILRAVRGALLLLALAGVLVTLLPEWPGDAWWIRFLDYPRLQFLATMLPVLVLLVVLPRRSRLSGLAAVALFLACAAQAARLAPFVAPLAVSWPPPAVAEGSCPAERRLRVLEVNVQMSNQRDGRLLEMVRRADPDIAWFQETDAWWEGELAPLGAAMPHGLAEAQENYYGIRLFSKLPLEDARVHDLTRSRNPSAFATAVLPAGQRVRIYALHPRPPQVGQSTAERDAQLMATALAAREDAVPHLAVGDLNTAPWAATLHRFGRIGGFHDPRVGRGLFITWNAKRLLLKWPLDHILPGPGLSLMALRVLPAFGSDHLPLLADLCLGPGDPAAREALDPGELARARATVERGQGRAVGPGAADPPGAETGDRD